jgi:hypothetical protein
MYGSKNAVLFLFGITLHMSATYICLYFKELFAALHLLKISFIFSDQYSLVSTTEELLDRKVAAPV